MTNEQINRAIAEACGWKYVSDDPDYCDYWLSPKGDKIAATLIRYPNYCNDLNAMAEAEKVLTEHQRESIYPRMMGGWRNPAKPIYATARQRAEAFLRTLGKWEEGK